MMRGYRVIKRSGNLPLIQDLHGALRDTALAIDRHHYSQVIFGASHSVGELVVRQTLAKQEHYINKKLLETLGKEGSAVALPLPVCWLRVIESHGFRIAYFRSSLLLIASGLKQLAKGVAQVGINFLPQFTFLSKKSSNEERFVYFCDLVDSNLPQPVGNSSSKCIINWYGHWQGRDKKIKTIGHSVMGYADQWVGGNRLSFRRSPLPTLAGGIQRLGYFFWAIQAVSTSLFDLIRGRWWHAMLLREASLAALVRYVDKGAVARQYFFHNSRFYPPLWTYELPGVGSEAVFYWYSTNSEPLQRPDGSRPFATPYSLMNWGRHLVWDESQAVFVRRCDGTDPKIDIVGPIWFSDSGERSPDPRHPVIAVFDVQPHRASRYCTLALPVELYVPEVVNRFLVDIADLALEFNARVVWKRKRNIGKFSHPTFERCAELLALRPEVIIANSSISPIHVIQNADVVISMPFTSTALIARHMGKPSIFYAPSFFIDSEVSRCRGIKTISGSAALREWVHTHLGF